MFKFKFQRDQARLTIDEMVYFNGKIPNMTSFSICYWEFIDFFSVTFQSIAAYCYDKAMDNNVMFYCLQEESSTLLVKFTLSFDMIIKCTNFSKLI